MTLARETKQPTPRADIWLRWGVMIVLSVYLLFAHPCHGDEDTELFSRFAIWMGW